MGPARFLFFDLPALTGMGLMDRMSIYAEIEALPLRAVLALVCATLDLSEDEPPPSWAPALELPTIPVPVSV